MTAFYYSSISYIVYHERDDGSRFCAESSSLLSFFLRLILTKSELA